MSRNDDAKQLEERYRQFDVRNLIAVVTGLIDNVGVVCTKLRKCVEGQYNKAYILTMSNGDELIARLPNPNAGPEFYTTASEVATRNFVRDVLGIPVPKIRAWLTDASNPVGAEYIIEEKAAGQPLGGLWAQMSNSSRFAIIDQLIDVEKKLSSISFARHGCIYYARDIESRNRSWERLDSNSPSISNMCRTRELSGFAIGPSNNRQLWQNGRGTMHLDRGPWSNLVDYATAIGTNELQWAESYAEPRMNFHRSMEKPETREEYISLLQPLYPLSLQRPHPQMIDLSPNPRTDDQSDQEKELLSYYYQAAHAAGLSRTPFHDPYLSVRLNPIALISGCWEREDTFSLRQSLISVVAHWEHLCPDHASCPIDFTARELEDHERESELISGISGILSQLDEQGLIPLGGMVPAEEHDHARMVSDYFKQEFVGLAENEQKRELHAKVWPY
ncbi:Phosphotransferase enzyme family [Aspergillus sclerotialis]|uniref:Altered inheritance of mitochondria protein 9, mitochondrial n=1 Tax=Aspergillus sclerotialis TaxID=2070753 RepID=A0A3A2ZSN2_9EURO|nr:Phosphotransferase enzyme family [Aspergillus sclerotialis]